MVYRTNTFCFEIAPDGTVAALVDRRDQVSYLAGERVPLLSLVRAGQRHEACEIRSEAGHHQVSFEGIEITAALRISEGPDWLVFELVGLSEEVGVEEVTFLHLRVVVPSVERQIAPLAGCVRSARVALACQTLDVQTESVVRPGGEETSLEARCYGRLGLAGRAALIAAPAERFLPVVEQLEVAEGLPHPTVDGEWARTSPKALTNYLFIDLTEQNADEIIGIARDLGFGYILVYANVWAVSLGTYEINPESFPGGLDSLKAVVDKAHAAGLKVGIHCLTGFVRYGDPRATPVPDPRLAKDGRVTLAAGLDEAADVVPTVESPEEFPSDRAFGPERQGLDVQIDDEIITYRGLSLTAPFGLQGCERGARGTRPAAHAQGATVWHLTQRYSSYLVDCDTDLAEEVAQRYADVINQAGCDMIYFDGGDAYIAMGREWAWHYMCFIPLLSARLWQREVRMGGACNGPLLWHLKTFRTCNDFVEIAMKRFFDHVKLPIGLAARDDFVPLDFGWWGLHSWAPHRRATTPDEIEYVCQKALAYGACWSLETRLEEIESCGRWQDIEKIIASYQQLRQQDTVPESVRSQVRELGAEFKLVGAEGDTCELVPARYGPAHLVCGEETATWTLDNDLDAQPLRFRLYALPELEVYGSPDNPVLVDQSELAVYRKSRTHAECRTTLGAGDGNTPAGEPCVAFRAASSATHAGGWAEHRVDLAEVGAQEPVTAMIEGLVEDTSAPAQWARPLGLWIHGDGQGEVLNIQLQAANGGYRDHYVDVDFHGWRYCELTQPETDRVFAFDAGYMTKHATRHFHYGQLISLYVRYNSIPAGAEVCCLVGPVKALKERWLPVRNPCLTVGDQSVVFPCELQTEQYLEFDGEGAARLFDREGVAISDVEPQGSVPVVSPGANEVRFEADAGPDCSRRAEVVVIRYGQPQA